MVANTNGVATGTANVTVDLIGMLASVNWISPTWDLFIVLFFIVTVFLYGMSLGRDRIIVILVAIYMALAVVSNAPFLGRLQADININQYFAFKVTTFLGVFILLFFLMSRSALLKTFANLASGSWWQVMLFSAFHVGLLVSITLSFLPPDAVNHLAPLTRQVFASETGKFVWIVMPIVGMVMLRGGDK
ncbi:MAG: hypothetical protein AAB692_00120 [Patescibacteria group bacterium]